MVRVRRYKIRGGGWGVFPLDRWDVQEVISFLQKDSRNTEQINRIFQKAIKNKDFLMIQTLLWNRVKIEALNDSNQTAIHLAAAYDYPTIIDRLFRHCNNDVNHTDVNGFTHFHIACISGKTDIVERFVKNGVDVNLRFRAPTHDERNDFTPLHFAVRNAKLEVVELLLKRQADTNAKDYAGRTPLHHACGLHAEPSTSEALQDRTVEIVRLLIRHAGDVNVKDRNGDTPLCRVFHDGTTTSCTEERLLKHPVDLLASDGVICKTKRKLIHQLRTRQAQKLKLLLENGVDANARVGGHGDTILHRAIGDLKASRSFAEFGLLCFEDNFHADMVESILKHGVDVDAKNDKGETPLSIAASLLSADVVAVLLKHNADVQAIKFDCFYHPKTIPCLEAVENLMEIAAMRESRGCHLSQSENLKIIKFFVSNNEGCRYGNLENENGSYKLRNLLEFGTDDNLISSLDKISRQKRQPKAMLSYHINRYLVKLRNIGSPLSQRVEDYLREKISSESSEMSDRHLKECEAEADKLKSLTLKNNRSLTDLLTASAVELYSFLKTGEHKQIFNAFDFPHNSGVIQGYFAKCLTRRFVLKAANDYVRCVTATPLPDPCCERISTYLSNEELLKLCLAIEAPRGESASNESTKSETV